jgi:two-component system, cell cycle sensor histidine kinase and response regulator CckA
MIRLSVNLQKARFGWMVEAEHSYVGVEAMGATRSLVRVAFETARLRLAEIRSEGVDVRNSAYRVACEQSARTLGVERVSIWLLADNSEALLCMLQYEMSRDCCTEGERLVRDTCPEYFKAVMSRRVIVVPDVSRDPTTAELKGYLRSAGVGALLDAPIYRDGEVIGVVCHEHVGGVRAWTEKEAGFASAVADMLTILIEQAERAELRAAIDAQRQMEAQNEKMHALVKLARVVTHDLSNVLTIASLRAGGLGGSQELDTASSEMMEVLNYGGELLKHLRDFCEERTPAGQVEITEVMRVMKPVLSALLGQGTHFEMHCELEPTEISIARLELEQVLMNLCVNAKDATRGNAKIVVRVDRRDNQLLLEVQDNGVGMSESTQARLFEPFYSTKPGHQGIGLAAVYGIVQRAHGSIDVCSTLGEGCI